jgi:hypothetical protein
VGAAGAGIFDDDTACDVRDEYHELLQDQVDDREATRRTVDRFLRELDADERHLLWFALAAAQSQWGRLDPEVRNRALALIDAEAGLEAWHEAGALAVASRRAVLQRLRNQLTGPQPPRKTCRRRWRHRTNLLTGDLLVNSGHGWVSLWLVCAVAASDHGLHPLLRRLAWPAAHVPRPSEIHTLTARGRFPVAMTQVNVVEPLRHRPQDPDWAQAGFSLLANDIIREPDTQSLTEPAWMTGWGAFGDALRRLDRSIGPIPEPAQQVGFLITTWDPLEIGGTDLIETEYDALVEPLMARLTPRTTSAEIATVLNEVLLNLFGSPVASHDVRDIAHDLALTAATWIQRPE